MYLKRRTFFLILVVSVLLAALGGGLISGLAVFSLSSPPAPTTPAEPTPTAPNPAGAVEPTPFTISMSDFSTTITDAVEHVSPSVVTVLSQVEGSQTAFGRSGNPEVSGSGVIFSPEGYILTNNHVVENAQETRVILSDGRELPVEIVGTDSFADLAVLKADNGTFEKAAVLGNSDNLNPGEPVIAIGSPLGRFKNTVTLGVVSATDRMLRVSENYQMEGLIQTDAAINQGNSGGPLINLAGEVVGINTLIVRGGSSVAAEGLGFAIPSNMAQAIASQIIENGYVSRPFLGIRWEWITPRIAEIYDLPVDWGAYVSSVVPGTPAADAELERGDIIVKFGARELNSDNPFINALYDFQPGEKVPLTIQRGPDQIKLQIILAEQPNAPE